MSYKKDIVVVDGDLPGTTDQYTITEKRKAHDSSVTFEEYIYHAKRTREEEENLPSLQHPMRKVLGFGKKENQSSEAVTEMQEVGSQTSGQSTTAVSQDEWTTAARAMRTATWSAVFYLITTDILGPGSVPWSLSQMGWVPGLVLYTIFGAAAVYTGWQIWKMFMMLDSYKHPLKSYGDLAFRVFGSWARHIVNILQSIQLIVNVGLIIIGNGQGIYQINSKICFTVASLIWLATGMVTGQIRTLQRLGWLSNFAIWINLVILFVTMAVVARTPPNYEFSHATNNRPKNLTETPFDPVMTSVMIPVFAKDFTTVISGLMQAVFAYGGAMLFTEFLAEMRRPMDFWKALLLADIFIYLVYMVFGIVVYAYQGQYAINPASQGMSPVAAYTAGNIISFISAVIAATLYGNIGVKVIYVNVLQEFFGFPELTEKKGKLLWMGLVPIYWSLAFVIASAIPNLSDMSAFLAALCIIQFTYTFPPILMVGAMMQRDSVQEDEGYDPVTGQTMRRDSGIRRWARGYFKHFFLNTFNVIVCLCSLVTAGLGMYSSIIQIREKFATGMQKPFGCKLGT